MPQDAGRTGTGLAAGRSPLRAGRKGRAGSAFGPWWPTIWLAGVALLVVSAAVGRPCRTRTSDASGAEASTAASRIAVAAAETRPTSPGLPASKEIPLFPFAARWDLAPAPRQAGTESQGMIQLCQCSEPVMCGVDCSSCPGECGEPLWSAWRPIPWQVFAHGEYVGPHRSAHVPEYRLRADDQLEFVYRFTHEASSQSYRLDVGDEVVIESVIDPALNRGDLAQGRGLTIQPDGTITLRLLGQVPVAGRTVEEVRQELEARYQKYYVAPAITVTPLKTNTKLEDLRQAIDSRFGGRGQVRQARVTPEGTIQLPGIGSAPAHGLTLEELKREVEERYRDLVGPGVEVTPALVQRAPRFVYVLGEVANPGRYTLEAPTTVMQAIALAGGWNVGGNLRQVVVFRRTEDWRLMATRLDLNGALLGKRPCPADEIWLRDSDMVVVPKMPILVADDFIQLVFTRGIYGVVPFQGVSLNVSRLSRL